MALSAAKFAVRRFSARAARLNAAFDASMADPAAFWGAAAKDIHWEKPFDSVLSGSAPAYKWFAGGMTNAAFNALDRHVASGRADQPALIYDSPVTGTRKTYTFRQLLEEVEATAGVLRSHGVGKGDRVLVYFPMVPEVCIAVMAAARIGAVSTTVFGGFASHELALRIDDFKPKVILAGSAGLEGQSKVVPYKQLIDGALEQSQTRCVEKVLMLQRPQHPAKLTEGYLDWEAEVSRIKAARLAADPVWVPSEHPQYVIYTSGTTAMPKGIIRDTGGHIVALRWALSNVYGIQPGERMWAASDPAWVVGSSWIVWGPALGGATSTLYEGKPVGTPDAASFWRVLKEHRINAMFAAPTALRAIKKVDPDGAITRQWAAQLPNFREFFVAGERCDPDTWAWAEKALGKPVLDNWWMTELGWPALAYPSSNGLGHPSVVPGSAGVRVPGWDLRVLSPSTAKDNEVFQVTRVDDAAHKKEFAHHEGVAAGDAPTVADADVTKLPAHHHSKLHPSPLLPEAKAGELGPLAIRLPLPPGALMGIHGNEARYVKSYLSDLPGYFNTGDAAVRDEDGYIHVMSRADDVINVAAHRLSTGAMEGAVSAHPLVAECAVFGAADELKGQVPWGVVVLKETAAGQVVDRAKIAKEVVDLVRREVGPVAAFRTVVFVARLPKTRSGKVLRATMKAIADNVAYRAPPTLDDPAVLEEITAAFKSAASASSSAGGH